MAAGVLLTACATATLSPEAENPLLRPLRVFGAPAEVLAPLSPAMAGDKDWRLVEQQAGYAHLVHYTKTLRFADDVELFAVTVTAGESAVAATSTSRIGIGDFGQNARNLADLLGRLREAWSAEGRPWREATSAASP